MSDKKIIYFPSLTTFSYNIKKGEPIVKDVSFKFYDKKEFGDFHHPYFLLTAGALYKKKDIREELGMKDISVFGDSGGFQIATGALKWDVKLREDIFNWLENNSDVAMNIDIPPTLHLAKQGVYFNECLKMTVDNMKWFEKHQTGKTDFLNVLQIYNDEQTKIWYDAVKDFKEFKGWGIGSANATIVNVCKIIRDFLINREFENKNFKWLHFLGKTSVAHFFIYSIIQKKLNELYPHVQVTTDSATPGMQAIFGKYYHSVNFKDVSFAGLYFGNKGKTKYLEDKPLPCSISCPICNNINFGNIANDGSKLRFYIAYHNLWLMVKALDDIHTLSMAHFKLLETILPSNFYKILFSITEMFDSGEPEKVFKKYKHLYEQFDKKTMIANLDFSEYEDIFQNWDEDNEKSDDSKELDEQKEMADKMEHGMFLDSEENDLI